MKQSRFFIGMIIFNLISLNFNISLAQSNQTFNIKLYNGNLQTFQLSDIKKITFVNNDLTLLLNNNTSQNWNASSVDYYFYQSAPTSIDEVSNKEISVVISPNPATTDVFINGRISPSVYEINLKIIDKLGRVVSQGLIVTQNGLFSKTIDVSKFKSGIYFFTFNYNQNRILTQKVIINE